MSSKLWVFAWVGAALTGCADDGTDPVVPPAEEDIFIEVEVPIDFDLNGQPTAFETRYFLDDTLFRELCILPDADSFDDYEELDPSTGEVIIERGTVPVSDKCPADGIVTGPMHEELYPSSWCRRQDCVIGEGPKEGGY